MESLSLPVVNMNHDSVTEDIYRACTTTGFFYLKDHGIDPGLLRRVYSVAEHFFSLDQDRKNAIAQHLSPQFRGYADLGAEVLNEEAGGDRKESFDMALEMEEVEEGNPLSGPNQWPEMEGFRPVLEEYFERMHELSCRLLNIMARSLGKEEDFFSRHMDKPGSVLRLIRYPAEGQAGCGEHTDYGLITILAQDETGGLQVKTREGEWVPAKPLEGAFVVNIADLMQRWTDDVYVSTPHRVVCTGGSQRFSVPFFVDPNYHAKVVSEKYPTVLAGDYLLGRLEDTH